MTVEDLLQKAAIEAVLNRYAEGCDRRQWAVFDEVFHADVEVNYGGEYRLQGRDSVVAMIRSMLGGCGPTQHLLGNFRIHIDGDTASSRCYVRAVHAGLGTRSDQYYEVWAEYVDTLAKSDEGWLITHRDMLVDKEVGSRDILAPEG